MTDPLDHDRTDDAEGSPFDDFQSAWQEQPAPTLTREEEMQLVADLKKLQSLRTRQYRSRDVVEGLACLFNVVFFGVWMVNASSQPERWGAACIVSGSIFIFTVLRYGRRPFADAEEADSIADSYRLHLTGERRQQRLLLWVPVWYIGPIFVGLVLINFGMFGPPNLTDERGIMSLTMLGFYTLLMVGLSVLNLWAAKRSIPAKIDEMATVARQLGEDFLSDED